MEDDDTMSINSNQDFSDPGDCIDQPCRTETFSIAHLIRGRQPKRQKTEDLCPTAFVRFNTSLGEAKPVTIKALLDSLENKMMTGCIQESPGVRSICYEHEEHYLCASQIRKTINGGNVHLMPFC